MQRFIRTIYSRLVFWLLVFIRGEQPTWRDLLRFGAVLPVAGGAGETTTTLNVALKEYYPGGGILDQLNVDTYLA